MAKKRRKKSDAAKAWAIVLIAVPLFGMFILSCVVAALVVYRFGVCPGVAAGGGTAFLCGLLWLGGRTYGEFPEGTPNSPVVMLGIILANGVANFEQCIPQMIAIAAGFVFVIVGIGGWILVAKVDPELNRQINPSLELKKDHAPPNPN